MTPHPDIDAIVAADAAARREVEAAAHRLADRDRDERARLEALREEAAAAARARLDDDVRRIEAAGIERLNARRAARQALRATRRARAERAMAAAIDAYVRIVRGDGRGGAGP